MWGYHHDIGAWAWWFMTAGMVLFWAVVVWVVVTLGRSGPSRRSPEDVLAERFARGEIGEADYRRQRDLIRQ